MHQISHSKKCVTKHKNINYPSQTRDKGSGKRFKKSKENAMSKERKNLSWMRAS